MMFVLLVLILRNKRQQIGMRDGKTIIEGGSIRFFNKEGKEIVYIGVDKKMAGKIQIQNRSGYKTI